MAHPIMFDDDDPLLARVRDLALAYPGADEKVSHGRPTFFTKKVFAYYWDEVDELLDASYRLTTGKRLIAELDGRRADR